MKLNIAEGRFPSFLDTADCANDLPKNICKPLDLTAFNPDLLEETRERIALLFTVCVKEENTNPVIWTHRTISSAVLCPLVRFINFIPFNPGRDSYLHIECVGENKDPCNSVFRYKIHDWNFLLPIEMKTKGKQSLIEEIESDEEPASASESSEKNYSIFNLSQTTIAETVSKMASALKTIESKQKKQLSDTLEYFLHDPDMRGIALSFETGDAQFPLFTCIWVKDAPAPSLC